MSSTTYIAEPFGPLYPDLGAGVAKFRRKAAQASSIKNMERADVVAYADAILKAIRAKQRVMHMKPNPPTTPGWYTAPSITRLLRYEKPIKMAGDPDWAPKCDCRRYGICKCDHWAPREKAVYAAAMKAKRQSPVRHTEREDVFA
jgi:hypothetical protein